MTQAQQIRNNIIDRLLTIDSPDLLSAVYKILESKNEDQVKLSDSQLEMLQMSEEDIKNNDILSQEEIDKLDSEWAE